MPFENGKPKTGGRTKDTLNVANKDLRETVRHLVKSNAEQIAKDLQKLKPNERVRAWLKLAEFVLPILNRTEMQLQNESDPLRGSFVIELQPPSTIIRDQGNGMPEYFEDLEADQGQPPPLSALKKPERFAGTSLSTFRTFA